MTGKTEVNNTTVTHREWHNDSVALKRNAAGAYYWDIKVHFDHEDPESQAAAMKELRDIDTDLKAAYK